MEPYSMPTLPVANDYGRLHLPMCYSLDYPAVDMDVYSSPTTTQKLADNYRALSHPSPSQSLQICKNLKIWECYQMTTGVHRMLPMCLINKRLLPNNEFFLHWGSAYVVFVANMRLQSQAEYASSPSLVFNSIQEEACIKMKRETLVASAIWRSTRKIGPQTWDCEMFLWRGTLCSDLTFDWSRKKAFNFLKLFTENFTSIFSLSRPLLPPMNAENIATNFHQQETDLESNKRHFSRTWALHFLVERHIEVFPFSTNRDFTEHGSPTGHTIQMNVRSSGTNVVSRRTPRICRNFQTNPQPYKEPVYTKPSIQKGSPLCNPTTQSQGKKVSYFPKTKLPLNVPKIVLRHAHASSPHSPLGSQSPLASPVSHKSSPSELLRVSIPAFVTPPLSFRSSKERHERVPTEVMARPATHRQAGSLSKGMKRPINLGASKLSERKFELRDCGTDPQKIRDESVFRYRQVISNLPEGISLSGQSVAPALDILKANNITHIINLAGENCPNLFPNHFTYLSFFFQDIRTSNEEFESVMFYQLDFIRTALQTPSNRVLIHCAEGISRSASIGAAYLMWLHKISFAKALGRLREYRPVCNPNTGFTFSLLRYCHRFFHNPNMIDRKVSKFTLHHKLAPVGVFVGVSQWERSLGCWIPEMPVFDPQMIFLVRFGDNLYLWFGKQTNAIHRRMAEKSLEDVKNHILIYELKTFEDVNVSYVTDGEEPDNFYADLLDEKTSLRYSTKGEYEKDLKILSDNFDNPMVIFENYASALREGHDVTQVTIDKCSTPRTSRTLRSKSGDESGEGSDCQMEGEDDDSSPCGVYVSDLEFLYEDIKDFDLNPEDMLIVWKMSEKECMKIWLWRGSEWKEPNDFDEKNVIKKISALYGLPIHNSVDILVEQENLESDEFQNMIFL